MAITARDTIRKLCPPWLQNGVAEKYLYALAIQFDFLMYGLIAGIKLRFPNVHSNESLPLLGRDRRIRRGRNETDAAYAARLVRWLDDHLTRGGPYAMLKQLHGIYGPSNFPIQLVYYTGRRYSMDVQGNVTVDDITWTPDTEATKWARWWLFFEWPTPLADDGLWGTGPATWGDGGVWGSSLTIDDAEEIRATPREWNAAHCFGQIILLRPGQELWGYPPGTWGAPGVWGSGPATLEV